MTTPVYGWPYPASGDEVDVPQDIQDLAVAIETDLDALADTVAGLGGGGGGSTGGGRWTAGSTAQDIPATVSGEGTIVALGSLGANQPSPTLVTRTVQGSGHKFALASAGQWACGATVRVASSATAGEVSAAIWADLAGGTSFTFSVAHDGGRREGLARTLQPSRTLYLPAGTTLAVFVYNGTGGTRALEPNAGAWVNLDLALVG